MLDAEQELEINGNGYLAGIYIPINQRIEGEYLVCDVEMKDRPGRTYDYGWRFWAKSGVMVGLESMDNPTRLRPKSAVLPQTNYFLFAGHRDWGKEGWVKLPNEQFTNGKDAAVRMKEHNGLFTSSLSPFRLMVKPETELSPVCDYKAWAEFRFESGEYQRLPWADEDWFKEHQPAHHFAHFGVADNCMVAFWESEINAQSDIHSVMTPGRYLTKYFSEHLSETEIQQWAVKVDVECELKFVTEPDDIVRVYTAPGAPNSCMSHAADEYECDGHPVAIYGAGDLAIAYLERRGKIIARAICWPEKKVFGRRYGDVDRLLDKLTAEGYTPDRGSSMNGARVLRIEDGSKLVAPYMDLGYGMSFPPPDMPDREKFMVMTTNYSIDCTNTDGFASGRGHEDDDEPDYDYYCDDCGEGLDGDDAWHLGDNVYCEFHHSEHTFECYHCELRYDRNERNLVDDENYCNACYREHTYSCDYCGSRACDVTPVYDARSAPDDLDGDACQSCIDDNDSIQIDHAGHWINTEHATLCENCSNWRSDELELCPVPTCDPQAANQNQLPLENQEVEQAA